MKKCVSFFRVLMPDKSKELPACNVPIRKGIGDEQRGEGQVRCRGVGERITKREMRTINFFPSLNPNSVDGSNPMGHLVPAYKAHGPLAMQKGLACCSSVRCSFRCRFS